MYAGKFVLFLLRVWLERRTPLYFDDDPLMLGGDQPPSLPPSGTPQIGRASTALTPSRPGPVARRVELPSGALAALAAIDARLRYLTQPSTVFDLRG